MHRSSITLGMVVACVGLAYGCSGDDDASGGGGGGDAGTSGKAGTSGASARGGTASGGSAGGTGASGRAGRGGRGGSSSGASGRSSLTGGSSGNAEGGASGQAGGGASGTAGGGAGGEAPVCDAPPTPHKLTSSCATVAIPEGSGQEDTLTTNCSFHAACDAVGCGTLWSSYDANLCRRPLCHSSAECGTGERCLAPPLLGDFNCYFDYFSDGVYANSLQSDCSCAFEPSECAPRAYCLSAADYPPADDCDVTKLTCYQLSYAQGPFDWLGPLQLESTSDLGVALDDCQTKIRAAYAACQGGAGGEGGGHSQ